MKTFTLTFASLIALAGISFVGCSAPADNANQTAPEGEPDAIAASNTHCPIMGGKVTADGGSADWNGKIVGFCCPECITKWEALSDEEKQAALDKAAKAGESGEEAGQGDHEGHGDHKEAGDSEPAEESATNE